MTRTVLTAALAVGALTSLLASDPAAAQPAEPPATTSAPPPGEAPDLSAPRPPIDVVEVIGRIDVIEADFIARSIRAATEAGSQMLVIQLNSPGAILSDVKLDELAFRVSHASLPVTVWVGPSGARAYGGAVRLVRAAAAAGMANGTSVGRFRGECPLCPEGDPLLSEASLSADEARRRLAIDTVSPTLGDFIVEQNGKQLGGRQLETARVVVRGGEPRREPIAQARFAKLTLVERILHATTSPQLVYLLLVLGLLLIVFEFFSVGIGVAGVTGAGSLILGSYGLAALGARPLALGLIALAVLGFSIDVQAGAPRAWTIIGTVALLLGSWTLFPGDGRVPWPAILVIVAGTVLFMVRGMGSMVRARFSTATIGRESLIGQPAEATTAIAPDGVVRLRGALWRARANRAAPISAGDTVRVVAIDGLVLEVERREVPAGVDGPDAG